METSTLIALPEQGDESAFADLFLWACSGRTPGRLRETSVNSAAEGANLPMAGLWTTVTTGTYSAFSLELQDCFRSRTLRGLHA
jgi:hypothetical protein